VKEQTMKVLAVIGFASAIALAAVSPAQARQGCGPGSHRIPNGRCVPNRGDQQMQWVEGRYYAGHGYWYHNQWRHRRERRNGVWIYL
jgi:hypothetical protein